MLLVLVSRNEVLLVELDFIGCCFLEFVGLLVLVLVLKLLRMMLKNEWFIVLYMM